MAVVGILGYAAFHHVEHRLTDGRVHHLQHTSAHAACLHQLCAVFALVMDCAACQHQSCAVFVLVKDCAACQSQLCAVFALVMICLMGICVQAVFIIHHATCHPTLVTDTGNRLSEYIDKYVCDLIVREFTVSPT